MVPTFRPGKAAAPKAGSTPATPAPQQPCAPAPRNGTAGASPAGALAPRLQSSGLPCRGHTPLPHGMHGRTTLMCQSLSGASFSTSTSTQQAQALQAQAQAPLAPSTPGPRPQPGMPAKATCMSFEEEVLVTPGMECPLMQQIGNAQTLLATLARGRNAEQKVAILQSQPLVQDFLSQPSNAAVARVLGSMPAQQQHLLLCLPAIQQAHVLVVPPQQQPASDAAVRSELDTLAGQLARVEQFYDSIGGLIGYQLKSLQLIVFAIRQQQQQQQQPASPCAEAADKLPPSRQVLAAPPAGSSASLRFHVPRGLDLAGEAGSQVGVGAAAQGLAAMPFMAEVYPVGGAGDRLGLVDEATGKCLPAAMLPYAGRSLLEVLLRDLQAREYLYYKLTGRQVTTPVAIMTSDAKGNHGHVVNLLDSMHWMGRPKDSYRLFRQPMVPMISGEDGRWLLKRPLAPMMKPGGHGAIWKLMWDEGVFSWLDSCGSRAALVRQISNPMAGTDTTLLALAGTGFAGGHSFGFMSCERAVGAAEGMNVVAERRAWVEEPGKPGRWRYEYGVTNVEYTEFERLGLSDEAVSAGSKTSIFPANTNVLYVGLQQAHSIIKQAVELGLSEQLLPGLIFNLKKKVEYTDPLTGVTRKLQAGRMESTMQNIADFMVDSYDEPLPEPSRSKLSTFLVSNLRRKVTSSAKKRREPGSARIAQTPDGSFYDLQRNAWQLLQRCGLSNVPEPGSPEQYLTQGPGFMFLYHPALGPLWDVISQKVVGGSLAQGSELVLEVAEARVVDLALSGSLLVHAQCVMGHQEEAELMHQQLQWQHAANATANDPRLLTISAAHGGVTQVLAPPQYYAGGGGGSGAASAFTDAEPPGPAPGLLRYSSRCGRVQLVNVAVRNAGVDWAHPGNVYWKHAVARHEACRIVLLGHSEFEAYNVTIAGNQSFVVPDGYRMVVSAAANGELVQQLLPLRPAVQAGGHQPTWQWRYAVDGYGNVCLHYERPQLVSEFDASVYTRGAQGQMLDFSI